MTTDTALIEKREELKRRLAAGEYKTLVDVLFDWLSRIIQKITRSSRPLSQWFGTIILFFLIIFVQYIIALIAGDASNVNTLIAKLPPFFPPLAILISYSVIASMVVGNIYVHSIFITFRDCVVDATESLIALEDIEHWLNAICNRKAHLFISVIGGGLLGGYLNSITGSVLRTVVPSGTTVGTLLVSVSIFVFIYMLLYIVILAAKIGRYDLNLYAIDPGSTEVIGRLNGLLSGFVYLVSLYAAFLTLATTLVLPSGFSMAGVAIVSLFWIPIIAMFILNQSSLSTVIRKAKGKTLNEIQARIEKLHASEKLGEEDAMDTINRLMDYYDRIKNTRSSRIDSGAVLNLINSLLLPLLALVLGNIDKILALFK